MRRWTIVGGRLRVGGRFPHRDGAWSGAVASAAALAALAAAGQGAPAAAAEREVLPVVGHAQFEQKISQTSGGFQGLLDGDGGLGSAAAAIGDLDRDGTADLAVGAPGDDDGGGEDRGAVWLLFLHPNGTVKSHQKISAVEGGFTGVLDNFDFFGISVSSMGDLDGDGTADLAVGALGDDDGGNSRGAVWILFLHPNGTVKSHQKISAVEGGFTGGLDDFDGFGRSVSSMGDVDGDGTVDLAVGATGDDDGGEDRGAVWVLFLAPDGTVESHQKISAAAGGFTGTLDDQDSFGSAVASLGDLDCDGHTDLAVGAGQDDDGGVFRGAVWILLLGPNGAVRLHTKISDTSGGFIGDLDDVDLFGFSVAALGDLDGDRNADLAVGAPGDDDGSSDRGAAWILYLDGNGCFVQTLFEDGFESGHTGAWSATVG